MIRFDPNWAWSHRGRGHAWYAKHEYDKAIADYSAQIQLDPEDAEGYHDRGTAWADVKEYAKRPSPTSTKPSGSDPQNRLLLRNAG